MEYRVLVDENTSPRVAEALRGKGVAADHVHEALAEGVGDEVDRGVRSRGRLRRPHARHRFSRCGDARRRTGALLRRRYDGHLRDRRPRRGGDRVGTGTDRPAPDREPPRVGLNVVTETRELVEIGLIGAYCLWTAGRFDTGR